VYSLLYSSRIQECFEPLAMAETTLLGTDTLSAISLCVFVLLYKKENILSILNFEYLECLVCTPDTILPGGAIFKILLNSLH
jgi:hypothetical protein